MDEKKITNHYHFTDLGMGVYMIFVLVGVVVVVLALGVKSGDPWAIAISAVLVTLVLVSFGIVISEIVRGRANRQEVERSKVERIRDIDNIKENLALIEATSKVKLAEGKVETEGWKTVNQQVTAQNKLLSAGNDNGAEVEGFIFEESQFDGLDEVG